MVRVLELPPAAWILKILIGLTGFMISGSLLHSEIRKRRLPTTLFASRLLRLASAGCLWCGAISLLLLIFSVIPGFCMIRWIGTTTASYTQNAFLGVYQLSRLYYCFSNRQLRGNHGYPICLFLVMTTIAIIIWIAGAMLQIVVVTMPSKCGYRSHLSLFYRFRERSILFDGDSREDEWMVKIYYIWLFALVVTSILWEWTILLLYLCKIWEIRKSYKSKQDGVWDTVLFILHRIVIITIFYQFSLLFLLFLYTSLEQFLQHDNTVWSSTLHELRISGVITCNVMIYSFSVFMMMDHNTTAYFHFLHFLRRFRLKYLCFCCCHKVVEQQIEHLEPSQGLELQTNRIDSRTGIESSMFPDLSPRIGADSNGPLRETGVMSPKTVTVVDP